MAGACEQLLSHLRAGDPFDYDPQEVRPLQLAAAAERLEAGRRAMTVLDRRAEEAGVRSIATPADLVPLLFSHTTYKSYPDAIVANRNWTALGRWADSLSMGSGLADLDTSGAETLDDWLSCARRAGHHVYFSSGTSGKSSLFVQSAADDVFSRELFATYFRWAAGLEPGERRPMFMLAPSSGHHRIMNVFGNLAEDLGRPDAVHWLSSSPMLIHDLNELGRLRREIAEGRATPGQIDAAAHKQQRREVEAGEELERLAKHLVSYADEPVIVLGLTARHYALTAAVRRLGYTGSLHPASTFLNAGGLKGAVLPPDYADQIAAFFGDGWTRSVQLYGMVEVTSLNPACRSGAYHLPPWVMPLVLDKSGEHLAEAEGDHVVGRFGQIDLSIDGRWGGLISGDKVTVNLGRCACGRHSPAVADIARYSDLEGDDDKLTCAGSVEAYVRGAMLT